MKKNKQCENCISLGYALTRAQSELAAVSRVASRSEYEANLMDKDDFIQMYSRAMRKYIDKSWSGDDKIHVGDLSVSAISFSEAFYLIEEELREARRTNK